MVKIRILFLLFLHSYCMLQTPKNLFDPTEVPNLLLLSSLADNSVLFEFSTNRVKPGGTFFISTNKDFTAIPGGLVLPVPGLENSPIQKIIPRSRFLYEVNLDPSFPEGDFKIDLKDHYESLSMNINPNTFKLAVDSTPPLLEVRGGNAIDILELQSGFLDLVANEEIEWENESITYISLSGTAKNTLAVSSIVKSEKNIRIIFSGSPNSNGGLLTLSIQGIKDKAGNTEDLLMVPIKVFAFRSGPNMLLPKRSCAGIELDDGRRIVLGGRSRGQGSEFLIDGNRTLSKMEIFDPISSSFSYGTDMLYRRQEFDVIKLLDGRILVSGGFGGPRFHPDNGIIASTEIFDPITNTWSLGPEMTQGRMQHKMTLLSNGDVLVVGGITPFNPFDSIPSVDIIHVAENPNDMTVEFIGNLPKSRGRQAQVLARNGKVIIIGGEYLETLIPEQSGAFISEALDSIVIFDPITKTLSNSLAKVHKRFHHFAHELENGDILIYGGLNHRSDTGQPELRVQRYNPFTDSISNVGLNKYVREWGNSFAFAYGKDQVILAGGLEYRTSAGSNYTTVLDSETWSTASNRFYKTSNSLNARWEACALPYATNGGGMILGGRLGDVLRNTEEYSYE